MPALKLTLSDIASLEALIHETIRGAGDVALSFFNQDQKVWQKEGHKGTQSPVSEADLAVNDYLSRHLKVPYPEIGWLSEETEDDASRLDRNYVWVIDPIDGTRAFLKGHPHFTICIALLENNRPILSAILNPATEEFFHSRLDHGSFLGEQQIHVVDLDDLAECRMIGTPSIFKHPDWPTPWPATMHIEQRNSMAYRLALVAKGEFHATIAFSGKSDWDLVAADLIVQEAGGRITLHNGDPIAYNGRVLRHPSVLCAGPRLYEKLLTRTRDLPLT